MRLVRRGGVGGMGLLRVGTLDPAADPAAVGVIGLGVVVPEPEDFLIFMDEYGEDPLEKVMLA